MNATINTPGTAGSTQSSSSTVNLLGRLLDDATALLRNEVQLARAEALETVHQLKTRAGAMAAGGALIAGGALTLIAAAVLGLAQVVPAWAAALIVGGALLLLGWAMLAAARKRLIEKPLIRTRESFDRDAAVVARRTS